MLFNGPIVEFVDHGHLDEIRFATLGRIRGRVYGCVYTDRGEARRIISLRKANRDE